MENKQILQAEKNEREGITLATNGSVNPSMKLTDRESTIYKMLCECSMVNDVKEGYYINIGVGFEMKLSKFNALFISFATSKGIEKFKILPQWEEIEHACKWYWLKNRNTMGFYPTVKIYPNGGIVLRCLSKDDPTYHVKIEKPILTEAEKAEKRAKMTEAQKQKEAEKQKKEAEKQRTRALNALKTYAFNISRDVNNNALEIRDVLEFIDTLKSKLSTDIEAEKQKSFNIVKQNEAEKQSKSKSKSKKSA